jgi:ribonuclease T2
MNRSIAVIAILVLGAICTADAYKLKNFKNNVDTNKGDNSWDYLLYVSRWAGTAGNGHTLPSYVNSWTLHGIWPQRNDGSWPSFCNNSDPFDRNQIQDLYNQLEVAWYDYQGDGYAFWQHEWIKHGTCAESLSTLGSQHQYFASAIKVHSGITIAKTLENAGYTPSDTQSYAVTDIMSALESQFGTAPQVTCSWISGVGSSINGVTFCLDKKLNIMQCPSSQKNAMLQGNVGDNQCKGQIYFPTIQH